MVGPVSQAEILLAACGLIFLDGVFKALSNQNALCVKRVCSVWHGLLLYNSLWSGYQPSNPTLFPGFELPHPSPGSDSLCPKSQRNRH